MSQLWIFGHMMTQRLWDIKWTFELWLCCFKQHLTLWLYNFIRQTHPQWPESSHHESNIQLLVRRRILNPAAECASCQSSSWSEPSPWKTFTLNDWEPHQKNVNTKYIIAFISSMLRCFFLTILRLNQNLVLKMHDWMEMKNQPLNFDSLHFLSDNRKRLKTVIYEVR